MLFHTGLHTFRHTRCGPSPDSSFKVAPGPVRRAGQTPVQSHPAKTVAGATPPRSSPFPRHGRFFLVNSVKWRGLGLQRRPSAGAPGRPCRRPPPGACGQVLRNGGDVQQFGDIATPEDRTPPSLQNFDDLFRFFAPQPAFLHYLAGNAGKAGKTCEEIGGDNRLAALMT